MRTTVNVKLGLGRQKFRNQGFFKQRMLWFFYPILCIFPPIDSVVGKGRVSRLQLTPHIWHIGTTQSNKPTNFTDTHIWPNAQRTHRQPHFQTADGKVWGGGQRNLGLHKGGFTVMENFIWHIITTVALWSNETREMILFKSIEWNLKKKWDLNRWAYRTTCFLLQTSLGITWVNTTSIESRNPEPSEN